MTRTVRPPAVALAALLAAFASPCVSATTPLTGIVQLAAGSSHTCALTSGGGVKCWGLSLSGNLGDGTNESPPVAKPIPTEVTGLASGMTAVAAGNQHTCALTAAGGVKCWGSNVDGQLGDGTTINRGTPTDVSGLASGVVALSLGTSHSCALTAGGGVKCWGANYYAQVGDGTLTKRLTPTDVVGLASGVASLSAGGYHNCVRTTGGAAKCWGYNFYAQIDGTRADRLAPIDLPGFATGVAGIAAGASHTCILATSGTVKCWGDNRSGQAGNGSTTEMVLSPVDVAGLGGISAIAAGNFGFHTCALTQAGGVKCWGYNQQGQVGDGTTVLRAVPVDVLGLSSGIASLAIGGNHSCALTSEGLVKCWGASAQPNFLATAGTSPVPVDVPDSGSGWAAISGGEEHTCGVTMNGAARCWGRNEALGVGSGLFVTRLPVDVAGLSSGVASIAVGSFHACAVTTAGGVKCWGARIGGQVGDGTLPSPTGPARNALVPVDVVGLASGVRAVAAGSDLEYNLGHTCAITNAGGLKCWGQIFKGQVGDGSFSDGTTFSRPAPVDVVGLASGVESVSLGGNHSCAVVLGGLKCWGHNGAGQVGDGTGTDRSVPVDVIGLSSNVAAVAAGYNHTCALGLDRTVKCWGHNGYGQLGDGTTTHRSRPVDVVGLPPGIAAISAGALHTCALTNGGAVWCWGFNGSHQLGDGTTQTRLAPVMVAGFGSGARAIAAGNYHTCALTTVGGARCWGYNSAGQLADGYPWATPSDLVASLATITARPAPETNSTSATFAFSSPSSGTFECSLDGAAFAACASPQTYAGLSASTHSFRLRLVEAGTPQTPLPTITWLVVTSPLSANPPQLDFGAQSMNTSSAPMGVTFSNPLASSIFIVAIEVAPGYAVSPGSTCTQVPAGGTCRIDVSFTPDRIGPIAGWVRLDFPGGTAVVELKGVGEKSLVTHYYRSILRRAPDTAGKAFWEGEAVRMPALGASVNETWYAMAQQFYASAEYAALNRDDTGFVTDLYGTFFNRAPDSGGQSFWVSNLAQGMPREVALAAFMFSAEFAGFTQAIFGNTGARAEVNTVVDFYRGLLARTPDGPGFDYWVGRFRAAQCSSQATILAEVESISSAYALSSEYAARTRTNAQYVGDLYNAFLRRGGDLQGVQFWIGQVASGEQTREQVRVQFKNSPEFQQRVSAIVAQGCFR